ncbi:MAG: M20/M25/M40 family metallo-hydrolase [Bacteroidales bacterium]|nr:M20/M25/M40 family metallo-hydrolase [Bacteroidales bacterium]
MIKRLVSVSILLFVSVLVFSQTVPQKGLSQITADYLKTQIDYLASDSLKGRNTPSPELDIAADYIARELERLGIKPVNGSYFQTVPLCSKNLNTEECALSITDGSGMQSFNLKTDYTPFQNTADGAASGNIVFVGYGITAPEYNYDDYSGIDVAGKVVLVMKHEPREMDTCKVFEGRTDTRHSSIEAKLKNAMSHGAVALMVVTDPLNHVTITPQGYSWPSLSKFKGSIVSPIVLYSHEQSIPCVQVGESVINTLFGSVDSLRSVQKHIDSTLSPASVEFHNISCSVKTKLSITHYTARNVVGQIEGADRKLKDEFLVVGGHYDHVGYKEKHKPGEDYIYNGADDNASGTAGVMAIAKAFSVSKKIKRSIMFIFFAGEEKGLYGSEYYTENPLRPLSKTVAMLNLDMISRNGDSLQVLGDKYNPELAAIVKDENKHVGLMLVDLGEGYFGASDHANFFKKDISSIFFFSGTHNDYHTVRDNPDTVDHVKAEKTARLAFRTAWRIVNENKYYSISRNKNE